MSVPLRTWKTSSSFQQSIILKVSREFKITYKFIFLMLNSFNKINWEKNFEESKILYPEFLTDFFLTWHLFIYLFTFKNLKIHWKV